MRVPLRLGPAETTLVAQLNAAGARAEAERFEAIGLPTRRVESYHYTDLKQLLRAVPPLAANDDASAAAAPALAIEGALRLSIVNGRVQPHAAPPTGVVVGKTRGGPLTERDDVLVRLNSALAAETLTLEIEGSPDRVIQIDRLSAGEAAHSASGVRVFLAPGASATIVETFAGSAAAHMGNHASFIEIGKGATLTHVVLNRVAGEATHFATHEYEIGEGAYVRTLTLNIGGSLSRAQAFARFGGTGANADFTGLNLVNTGQHTDATLEVRHAAGGCGCQPLFKQIARGRGRAVFQGKIVVERDAQKTDSKLMMNGLMLSEFAEILSKPELEIYADDVVCGHGSTCGKLDEDSLFYLVSRGIPQAEAETMLVRGFIAELIDPIADPALNAALHGVVEAWLMGQG
jgi:Fe-S cluster assembly protein SufD